MPVLHIAGYLSVFYAVSMQYSRQGSQVPSVSPSLHHSNAEPLFQDQLILVEHILEHAHGHHTHLSLLHSQVSRHRINDNILFYSFLPISRDASSFSSNG